VSQRVESLARLASHAEGLCERHRS
jgi:hypothetical protein